MTTPSSTSQIGLPISIWNPTIVANGSNVTYTPRGTHVRDLAGSVNFNMNLQADGGYWSVSFSLADDQVVIEDWIEDAIGRHVEIYDAHGVVIWEGFINKVSANIGGLSITRGPLTDITNRCSVVYGKQEIIGDEIVTTQGLVTPIADNEDSKLKYGIFENVVSGGTVWDDTEAEELRDAWLAENALPETSKQFSLQSSDATTATMECLGYIHFLNNYIYDGTAAGYNISVPIYDPTNANSKLREVLEADPNALFDDDSLWAFDTVLVTEARWDDQLTKGYPLIRTMVAKGDGSDNRMLFGIYAGRRIVYSVIPSAISYQQMLSDPSQAITAADNLNVFPWNVLPGNWMLFTDFLVGRTIPTLLREDPRALFIERVAYTTPWGLQLDGQKVGTLRQRLARMGLGVS